MKVLLLAAGRGERMRPLTDDLPKPLIEVAGKPLIVHLIERLVAGGLRELVVNHAWHGARIEAALGDGARFGAHIVYSPEPPGALETGGAMRRALALLGAGPFIAVNADLWTDFAFAALPRDPSGLAHLVLVDNPPHHARGDFALDAGGRVHNDGPARLTFAGIGVYRPELVADRADGRFSVVPLLRAACDAGRVSGEHFRGEWCDVGTRGRTRYGAAGFTVMRSRLCSMMCGPMPLTSASSSTDSKGPFRSRCSTMACARFMPTPLMAAARLSALAELMSTGSAAGSAPVQASAAHRARQRIAFMVASFATDYSCKGARTRAVHGDRA